MNTTKALFSELVYDFHSERWNEFELSKLSMRELQALAKLLGCPKERISIPDSLCLEVQALTDFLRSNKIEVLNVAGPRESKEPGVYELTLPILRFSLNRAASAGINRST